MSKAFRVGIFVVLGLAILSVGVFLIGNKDFLFTPTYTLRTDFQNVAGLDNGGEVRVGGIHEGTISRIDLPSQPGGKITVEMKLHSSTQNLIRKDSIVSIQTEGLLGNKYLEISFGSAKATPLQDGDVIASEAPVDFSQQAKSLAADAKTGIDAFTDDMEALQHSFLLSGFFKKRGYNDTTELAEDTISKVPAGPRSKEFDYDAGKLFKKPDNADLKNQKDLDDAAHYLEDNKFGVAVVAVSAAIGDTDAERTLTKARAKVVRDYIVQHFKVDDTRIKTIGLGKSKQAGDSGDVQILIYAGKPAATPKAGQPTAS
jgi:outer membrane protein OmpA-like peptidoglycan-associated protein